MTHYEIYVTGVANVSQYVEVDADSEDEAIEMATSLLDDGERCLEITVTDVEVMKPDNQVITNDV